MAETTTYSGFVLPGEGEAGAGNSLNNDIEYHDGLPRIKGTLGEAMSEWHAGYLKSDGKVWKALAGGTPQNRAIGFLEVAGIADGEEYFKRTGIITRSGWNFTLIGQPVYLSTTVGGQVTQTPTDTEVGIAWESDKILLRNLI